MTIKATVYIATSLDGFIARANGDLDWLMGEGGGEPSEDYGYQAFMDTVDVIVMGRGTFEKVLTFDSWPYGGKQVVVLSSSLAEIPPQLSADVELRDAAPEALIAGLSARGAAHLYVDGGKTIQRFLDAGLIDELIVTRIPILIGDGIPLFGPLKHDIKLAHAETRQFASGFVQSRYRIIRQVATSQ
jgi:dihydrofolate reductase